MGKDAARPTGASEGIVDRRGKRIILPTPPKRVIALGPSVSETVIALEALDRLVGRSRFCNSVPELQKVPDMGGIADPSLEKILEARPDLVIGLEFLPEATAATLEKSGIPVALFDFSTWKQVSSSILSIGSLLGGESAEKSQEISSRLNGSLAEAANNLGTKHGEKKLKTLVMFDAEKPYSAGGDSYLGVMLRAFGADNIADKANSDWPELSRESVLEFDPEFILVLVAPEEVPGAARKVAQWRDDSYWSQLKAVKTGRVTVLRNSNLIVPGPGLISGILVLSAAMYPDYYTEKADTMEKGGEMLRPLATAK